jgi:hypothetical protein
MKLLHVSTARTIWLLSMLDLNPRGQALTQDAIDKISARYKFKAPPTITAALEAQKKNEPIHFAAGEFTSMSGANIVVDLKVYNDGLLADCRASTKDSEAFLADFFAWLQAGLGLPKTNVPIRKKMYVSELEMESKDLLTLINPNLAALGKTLAAKVPSGSATSYEMSSLAFATDPKDGTQLLNFRFERLINTPFAEHRYFSAAPVHTDDHLELLESLEKILTT